MAKVSSRPTGVILFGILNGLLPCGLSFGAAILSVNEANVAASAMFMVYFGLGTLPMLLVLSYVPKWMNKSSLTKLRSFSPKLMIVIGFLLVIRSMNFGIPYVSPTYNPASEKMECCSEE
jgi:sulfite exporter TauE/SafE